MVDDSISKTYPTTQDFRDLFATQLNTKTQEFTFDASTNPFNVTTAKGVEINLNTACLSQNGNAVTGECSLKVIELFDKGEMLVTNKPTYGKDENGDKSLLISAGEFYIEVFKDGNPVDINCGYSLVVPANLTGNVNYDMTLWEGVINDSLDIVWEELEEEINGDFNLEFGDVSYYPSFGDFWLDKS